MNRDCEHGQLARSCLICELQERLRDAEAELAALRRDALAWRAVQGATSDAVMSALDIIQAIGQFDRSTDTLSEWSRSLCEAQHARSYAAGQRDERARLHAIRDSCALCGDWFELDRTPPPHCEECHLDEGDEEQAHAFDKWREHLREVAAIDAPATSPEETEQ